MGKGNLAKVIAAAAATLALGGGIYKVTTACGCNTPTFASADLAAPTVAITSPLDGTSVAGLVTFSVSAGDNVGVVGVQLQVDGANFGAELTTAPYAAVWNTAGVSNASHTLTAVARDAAGNSAAATITVTVSNSAPGTGTANVWVSTGGSDVSPTCKWNSSPVTWTANGVGCQTLSKAASLATAGGGRAGVENGTYAANQAIAYNAALTNYLTFVPDGGAVNFQGQVCIGSANTNCVAATTSPDWIKFDATAGSGTFVYRGGIIIGYSGRQPNHIYLNGGHTLAVSWSSVANLTVNGMEAGPECCSADAFHGGWSTGPQDVNLVFTNNYIHGFSQTCANYPGQSADGIGPASCPGDTTVHVDCFQLDTGNNLTFEGNRCYANVEQGLFFGGTAGGMPAGTSCPVQSTAGCYEGTILIRNNAFADPIIPGNNQFILGRGSPGTPGDCVTANGNATNPEFGPATAVTIAYNSTAGSLSQIRSCSLPASITYTGNISNWPSFVACNGQVKTGGTETFSHNFLTGKTCGATDTLLPNFAATFVSQVVTAPDLHLLTGAPEIGGGDPANCPATDMDGSTRSLPCDAGADQHSGTGGTGLTSGLSSLTSVTSGGIARYFKTYKPPSLNDAAAANGVPLVIMLGGSVSNGVGSGCGGLSTYVLMANCDIGTSATACTAVSGANTACQMFASNWPAKADSAGLIVAEAELAPNTCINGGGCGGPESSPDGQFLTDLIAYVETHANINPSKVYLYGFSAGASQVMAVANGENGAAGAKFVFTTDWSTTGAQFAGFGIQAGALGGNGGNQIPANTPVFPTPAKPTIYVTSKNDAIIQTDDGNGSHTNQKCTTISTTCQLQASTINGLYATHWGCTGPALTTLATYDTRDYTCPPPAAYRWVSLNTASHSFASYNGVTDMPTLIWAYWAAH